MTNAIRQWFTPPVLGDEEQTRIGTQILKICVAMAIVSLVAVVIETTNILAGAETALFPPIDLAFAALAFVPVLLVRRGQVRWAAMVLVALIWLVATAIIFLLPNGFIATGIAYVFAVMVAGLLIGGRAAFWVAGLSSVAFVVEMVVISNGSLALIIEHPPFTIAYYVFNFFLVAVVIQLAYSSIRDSLRRVQANQAELRILAADLQRQNEASKNANQALELSERMLQQRLGRIAFMSEISASFVVAGEHEIDGVITNALQRAAEFTNVERGYLFLVSEDGERVELANEWCAPDVIPHRGILDNVKVADFTDFIASLKRGDVAVVQTADIPDTPDNKAMLDVLGLLHIKSFVNLGVTVEHRFMGWIGFDATRQPTTWSEETIKVLAFMGQIIGGALDRMRAWDMLRTLNRDLEQRVTDRTRQLEFANREMEAFAHSVSHDLRTPLRGIDGMSVALAEDCADLLPPEGKSYVARIRGATRHMSELIDDLLTLSRVSRNELHMESLDMSQMAHSIAGELRDTDPAHRVTWDIEPDLQAFGDSRLIRLALTNLLSNAWKFTGKRDDGRIEVGRTSHNGQPCFFIRDNGAGFDMAFADKLFGVFQRLHAADEFEGTGIGLATVQRIIQRHGGTIWAQARVNQGATFYFTLSGSEAYGHQR